MTRSLIGESLFLSFLDKAAIACVAANCRPRNYIRAHSRRPEVVWEGCDAHVRERCGAKRLSLHRRSRLRFEEFGGGLTTAALCWLTAGQESCAARCYAVGSSFFRTSSLAVQKEDGCRQLKCSPSRDSYWCRRS